MDRDEFIAEAEELLRVLDEDVPDLMYTKASGFFDSVREKAEAMLKSVREQFNEPSEKMSTAIQNMAAGVRRWTERD